MDMRGLFSSFGGLGGGASSRDHGDVLASEPASPVDEPPPSPVGQDERRMQVRAYNYWASLLGERNYPAIEDLEPHDLPDFGPYSVLLDFGHGIDNPSVAFLGDRLAVECGADVSIGRLGDVPSLSLLSRITDHYMQILANQAPIGFEAEFVNGRGATVLYRGILLPFSSDDDTIDFIYGVINWKELADRQTADALLLEIERTLAAAETDGAPCVDPAPRELVRNDHNAPLELDASVELVEGESWRDAAEADDAEDRCDGAEWDEAEHDGERASDASGENASSLVAMRLGRGERRKEQALLRLGDAVAVPDIRLAVNAPVAFFDDHAAAPHEDAGNRRVPLTGERALVPLTPATPPAPIASAGAGEDSAQADTPAAMLQRIAAAMTVTEDAAGLHDCLASARELADALRGSEDRSRSALYRAVSRAYDVSLAAADAPEEWAELLADNGLVAQDRAPMVPVVKLVFGADYDKTRLAEYAAVLTHARRAGLERGEVRELLRQAEGGLKGIVAAERALKRRETGDPAATRPGLPDKLLARLRAMEGGGLERLAADGPEFALVMVRRDADGSLAVLGEVPQDAALLAKAARALNG